MKLSTISGKGTCVVLKKLYFKRLYFLRASLTPCKKFSSLCNEMLWCCFPPSTGLYILLYFQIQASPHRLTRSFPSTNDSCVYLPVYYEGEDFYYTGMFTFPRCSSFDPHPPACLRSLFSTLVVEWCTWRSQYLYSPLWDAIFESPLTHMSRSWILFVFYVRFVC